MSSGLLRRVGVDVHFRNHHVPVGRVPVIVLVLIALGVVVGAMSLVLKTVQMVEG